MTKIFNGNFPISAGYDYHLANEKGYAIDYATPIGTDLYAVADGYLEKFTTWWGGSDTLILHGNNGVYYLYAHCLDTVLPNQQVKKGDVIAHSGNDGNSTGAHLHFSADVNYQRLKGYSTNLDTSQYIDDILNGKIDEEKKGDTPMQLEYEKTFKVKATRGDYKQVWTFADNSCSIKNGTDRWMVDGWEYNIIKDLNTGNYFVVQLDGKFIGFITNNDVKNFTELA